MADVCLSNLAVADILCRLPSFPGERRVRWIFGGSLCCLTSSSYILGFYAGPVPGRRSPPQGCGAQAFREESRRSDASVWLLSLLASLPSLVFTTGRDKPECHLEFPEEPYLKQFTLLEMYVLGLLLPLLVMLACYSRILPFLLNTRSSKKHRVVRLTLVIVVFFFLLWMHYNMMLLLHVVQVHDYFNQDSDIQGKKS